MKLDILIPTYNRKEPLIRNLEILNHIISNIKSAESRILISDNASTDGTIRAVEAFVTNHNANICLFQHKNNRGLTYNVTFLVSKSTADYIILLGDDDYLSAEYLQAAIKALEDDPEITCILPAFEAISESGERLGVGRDLHTLSKVYEKGVENVIVNSPKAHQISGIILKREGLYEALTNKRITNLYPQIFMVAYSCLRGKCLQITEYPVLVTQTNNKAWKYDDVGLVNDIFQNYHALELDDSSRYNIEKELVKTQRWRTLRYWKKPIKQLSVIRKISNCKYTSKRGHLLLPFILTGYWIKEVSKAVKAKLYN